VLGLAAGNGTLAVAGAGMLLVRTHRNRQPTRIE
jgi:hypothetical protein